MLQPLYILYNCKWLRGLYRTDFNGMDMNETMYILNEYFIDCE